MIARDDPALGAPPLAVASVGVGRFAARHRRRALPLRLKLGSGAVVLLGLVAAFVPPIFRLNPLTMDATAILQGPTWHYPFGTDDYGRNLLARVVFGLRTSFEIGLCTTALTGCVGLLIAVVVLRIRGVRTVVLRLLDALMALPAVVVALALVTLIGPGFLDVVIVESLFFVPWSTRMIRASMMKVQTVAFVEAAVAQGATTWRVIRRHILPNAAGPIVVQQVLIFGYAILGEAVLSFLGVGITSPTASLGNLLAEAQPVMLQDPLFSVFPGVLIAILVLSVNLVADGVAEQLKVDRTSGIRPNA
ncbi:MAG TPA: ABC transporter permease [Acidimicrobiales bacterium]|nr:ABC transporter permease [Acidimicrobiales bacterium]